MGYTCSNKRNPSRMWGIIKFLMSNFPKQLPINPSPFPPNVSPTTKKQKQLLPNSSPRVVRRRVLDKSLFHF